MKKNILALSVASALTSTLAVAAPAESGSAKSGISVDETLVVTASRIQQNSADILSSVKIITREEIDLSPALSIAELINDVNGFQLSQNGGIAQTTGIFSRGTNAGHTLVIIDGQRIGSATLGLVEFANISTDQIERVEIIKGPRASLWGSDAIGGVIQIFTRQLNAGELALDLSVGNQSQQQGSLSSAFAHGDGKTTITLSAKSAEGYDVLDNAEPDDDGYHREDISIIGTQNINPQWRVNWLAKYNQGQSDYDSAFGGNNKSELETKQWHLTAIQDTGLWYQQFSWGQQIDESIDFIEGGNKKDGSFFETKRLQANWLGSYQVSQALTTSVGVDLTREEVDTKKRANNQPGYDKTERDKKALYGHIAYDEETILLDGALRYDDIEGIDNKFTYNASAGLRFGDQSLISINLGRGFKEPSFNDLYYPEDAFSYGNPELKAETSNSAEILLKTSVADIQTELSVYKTKIDDLIEWVPDENFKYNPLNIHKATIKGAELNLTADLFGFSQSLQLGYLDAVNDGTNKPLIRRAKHTARYQISRDFDNLNLLASVNYQGKREDSEWPSTTELPSHTLVNLSAAYSFNSQWKLTLKANNLFDRDYVTNNHYVGQPAQYLLTLNYRQ
ncbi:TonB-dependent receptor [Thalassomonas sp. RHCl1]|uniref:TonB-dependent receptor domain-containing protein n=1 Tax=Thalassomonas sp. RHCl1 TaxID=2995320 RepID=UPI00248C9142|nr:TonB-dependent receptor [Thalassomonas sp. RHCl1]